MSGTEDIKPSEDLEEFYSLDTVEDRAEENIHEFIKTQAANSSITTDVIEDMTSPQFDNVNTQDISFSSDEGFIYYTAFEFYKELVKRARKYLKSYCKSNNYRASGSRALKDPDAGQKYTKEFNPFLYTHMIEKKIAFNTIDLNAELREHSSTIVRRTEETADEAMLQVAYAVGFSKAAEFTAIAAMHHGPSIQKVLNDPRYLATVRKRAAYVEESKQIADAVYINKDKRTAWMQDLSDKIQKELDKIKGAV